MVTDLHYADKPLAGSRHYRESLRKFEEAAKQFASDGVEFVVELGDFIDAADSLETEKAYLTTMTKPFAATPGQHHYVLGNHCVDALTKGEFLEIVGQPKSYDSSTWGETTLSCSTPAIAARTALWPEEPRVDQFQHPSSRNRVVGARLEKTPHKTMAFIHQRLDVEGHYGVKNALRFAGSWRSQAKCSPSSRATTTEMTSKRLAAPTTAPSPRWSRVAVPTPTPTLSWTSCPAIRSEYGFGGRRAPVVRFGRYLVIASLAGWHWSASRRKKRTPSGRLHRIHPHAGRIFVHVMAAEQRSASRW